MMKRKRSLRWIVRILLVLIAVLLLAPVLIPLPTVGVDAETLAEADGHFIDVNGLETYYREQGDPNGDVVLLLHGWGASTFSYRDTLPALAEAGYRVIAFDRPPYGLSTKTGENLPFGLRQQAEFTAAFMDALGIERASLVGHSMGGGVITYFTVMYPERVDKLVFVAGVFVGQEPGEDNPTRQASPLASIVQFQPVEWWARVLMRAFIRQDSLANFQRSAYFNQEVVTREVILGYGEPLLVENWDATILDVFFRSYPQDEPLTTDEVAGITNPSLIVWGEQDTWVPISAGERMRELLPNVEWITYANVGHLPMEEAVEQFNADVIAFLGRE